METNFTDLLNPGNVIGRTARSASSAVASVLSYVTSSPEPVAGEEEEKPVTKKPDFNKMKSFRVFRNVGARAVEADVQSHIQQMMSAWMMGISHSSTMGQFFQGEITENHMKQHNSIWFPRAGSENTEPHVLDDFTFHDFAPSVFKQIRSLYNINEDYFLDSLGGKNSLNTFSSNSARCQLFYVSSGVGQFIVKSISHTEMLFLLKILPHYFHYLKDNPDSLLVPIFSISSVAFSASMDDFLQTKYFIVMANTFVGTAMDLKFDLKGSTQGRRVKEKEKQEGRGICKDCDWIDRDEVIQLEEELQLCLNEQIQKDAEFLKSQSIIDYSLIIGIKKFEEDAGDCVQSPGKEVKRGIQKFNRNPKKGMAFLIEEMPELEFADKQAKFLKSNLRKIDRKVLGQYLSNKTNREVIDEYLKLLDLKGASILDTIRTFLEDVDLPGEAQQIDQITDALTKANFESNKDSLQAEPTGLAFAIILLNSDLHNPSNTNKMTCDAFISNLQNLNSLEALGLSEDSAKEIYERISSSPLNPAKAESPMSPRSVLQSSKMLTPRSIFSKDLGGIYAEAQNCRYYLSIVDYLTEWGITKRSESALKSLLYEQNSFSVVDPETYSSRFRKFIGSNVLGFEYEEDSEIKSPGSSRGFSLRALIPSISSNDKKLVADSLIDCDDADELPVVETEERSSFWGRVKNSIRKK